MHARPAPEGNPDGGNDRRLIRSRKGHELTFDDGEAGAIELRMNDGRRLRLDDQAVTIDDGKGNAISIQSGFGTIEIRSTRAIAISSPEVSIAAGSSMELKAGASSCSKAPWSRSTDGGEDGRAAARVGDPTSHGIPLGPGPGSPDVRIGGRPAWRGTDLHACPLVTRSVPHGSGWVVRGSATVLVNGRPVARRGDAIREAGAIGEIAAGEPTVRIG